MYVIDACMAIKEEDDDGFYTWPFSQKLLELDILATCRGMKHPSTRTVLRQLMGHADGHELVALNLAPSLQPYHSFLFIPGPGKGDLPLRAVIRDGADDEHDIIFPAPSLQARL